VLKTTQAGRSRAGPAGFGSRWDLRTRPRL